VNVTLCGDHALGEFYLAGRAYQLARAGSGYVTALTNGSFHAQGAGIGEGYFYLRSRSCGTENDYVGDGLLGAHNGNSLLAGELAGLAQILLVGEGVTLTEQDLDMLLGEVYVTGGGFYQNFICHDMYPFQMKIICD
jgi:hypothetical protein